MSAHGPMPVIRPHGGRHYRPQAARPKTYTYAQMKEWQAWSLEAKIEYAHERIDKALAELEQPCVAFSAGKDSTVLLHLVLQHKPDVLVMYGNTSIEFPECVRFARWLRDEWELNYREVRPSVSFWWVVEHYGWPLMGKTFGVGGVAHKESKRQFFDDLAARGELNKQYAIQAEVPISSAC